MRQQILYSISCFLASASLLTAEPKLRIQDGDRIVLIGDTLIEREQEYGGLETHFHIQFPTNKFIVRNLGWSGDTPAGISRLSFDFKQPAKGLEIIKDELSSIKPTIAFIGYGMASSFDGESKAEQFKKELRDLVKVIQQSGGNTVKLVFLSPLRHELWTSSTEGKNIEQHNKSLQIYSDAVKELAEENKALFISLYKDLGNEGAVNPTMARTSNGIHLNEYGYAELANLVDRELGWSALTVRLGILRDGALREGIYGITATNVIKQADEVSFDAQSLWLTPPPGSASAEMPRLVGNPILQIQGLENNQYNLVVDDYQYGSLKVTNGVFELPLIQGPDMDQAEKLRKLVVEKNKLYFYRWRPQNETYLFGFRKQEQGKNGKEIPLFDPLISAAEEQILALAKPLQHHYLITKKWAPERGNAANQPRRNVLPKSEKPVFEVADGFEVNLYAENPLLAKPIQMNFDAKGRLWVASSSVYPQIEPGQKANDKIIVIEDTKGIGIADKAVVFADGLLIPSAVIPGDGGVYVGQSTELLFFKDTNGDGKADTRKVVLSGLGTEDTHHVVHTLRWGMDGDLYFNQSIYIHSHLETPHGVVRLNSGGVFKYQTDQDKLDVLLRGFCNPWGTAFDAYGQSFVTDGAGFQGISYGIPGATYFTYADMRREMKSVSPGNYPKFAGLEIIQSEHFPEDWQGNMITCDFRAHRVVRFGLTEQGAGYVTRELPDLLRTTNVTFRPIDAKLGPDGALYIADWSNPIIQHGEVDFRDPRRDHEHGRIWRVTAKGRPLVKTEAIKNGNLLGLLNSLTSSNSWSRDAARRSLTEQGPSVAGRRDQWILSQTNDWQKLQGLWLKQSSRQVDTNLLNTVLAASDGKVRAAGIRVMSGWRSSLPEQETLDKLVAFVKDPHPRARLEAIRALGGFSSARAASAALSALDSPMDEFLDYALWLTVNELSDPWLEALQKGEWKPEGRERQLEFALKSIEPSKAEKVLSGLVAKLTPAQMAAGPWLDLIGQAGSRADLERLSAGALGGEFPEATQLARALNALGEAARLRNIKAAGALPALLDKVKGAGREPALGAIRLAGIYKSKESVPLLSAMAKGGDAELQKAVVEALRSISGPEAGDELLKISSGSESDVKQAALLALHSFDAGKAAQPLSELLKSINDENKALPIWKAIFALRSGSARLLPVITKNGLSPASARAGLRAARESNKTQDPLALLMASLAGVAEDPPALSDEDMKKLAAGAVAEGSAEAGEALFRRSNLGCLACHSIGGAGGKVGPDLTSIGASAPADYLVESLFYPNRKIKEGFHSVMVTTKDDQEFSGVKIRENGEELTLRDPANREISIPVKNIASRKMGGSLMPAGLMDSLSPREQKDLVRFLAELGKPGPYDAAKSNVARTWSIYAGVHTDEQFGVENLARGTFPPGKEMTAYTTVPGWISEAQIREVFPANLNSSLTGIYLSTRFSTARSGAAGLELTGGNPSGVWIDGAAVKDLKGTEIGAGAHTVTLRFEAKALPARLKLNGEGASFVNK